MKFLVTKMEDLENKSQCNNMTKVGIPEKEEGMDPDDILF